MVQGEKGLQAGPGGDRPAASVQTQRQPWPLRHTAWGSLTPCPPPRHEGRREGRFLALGAPTAPRPLTPMRWPKATEVPIMAAGEAEVRRLSVEAKTQSTSCRVRTSSTATAWPTETLLCTWWEGGPGVRGALPGDVPPPFPCPISPLPGHLLSAEVVSPFPPRRLVGARDLGGGWAQDWWERGGPEKLGCMFAS